MHDRNRNTNKYKNIYIKLFAIWENGHYAADQGYYSRFGKTGNMQQIRDILRIEFQKIGEFGPARFSLLPVDKFVFDLVKGKQFIVCFSKFISFYKFKK